MPGTTGRQIQPADRVDRGDHRNRILWRFSHPKQGKATVRITPWMSSNDGDVVRDWALAGLGIMVRSEWDVADHLAAGRLQEGLPGWRAPAADVVALLHARHGRCGRTSAFLQALKKSLAFPPWRRPPEPPTAAAPGRKRSQVPSARR